MPFFFVLPIWILVVIVGAAMTVARTSRRPGIYVLTTATFALVMSFVLSTVVLLVGAWASFVLPEWSRFVVLAAYFAAIPAGALLGAIAGFLLARGWLRRRVTSSP